MCRARVNRLANILLGVAFLMLAYGMAKLAFVVDPAPLLWSPFSWPSLLVPHWSCRVFFWFANKLNIALIAFSTAISCALGIVFVNLTDRSIMDILVTKVIREIPASWNSAQDAAAVAAMLVSKWQTGRPYDPRTSQAEVEKSLNDAGIAYNPFFNPHSLMVWVDRGEIPFYPLSSTSINSAGPSSMAVGCAEGPQHDWPVYRKDRYGFNNDDSIYAFKNPLMIVGGSFAMGSCVHQDETIQGVLRRNGYPTISTGIGASGAFAALGVLKEYGEVFNPPVVLWQFGDPNDICDIRRPGYRSIESRAGFPLSA